MSRCEAPASGRVGDGYPGEEPQGASLLAVERQFVDVLLDLVERRALGDEPVDGVFGIVQHGAPGVPGVP